MPVETIARPLRDPTSRKLEFEEAPAKQPYAFFEQDEELATALQGSFLHGDFMALEKGESDAPDTQIGEPSSAYLEAVAKGRSLLTRRQSTVWEDSQLDEPSPIANDSAKDVANGTPDHEPDGQDTCWFRALTIKPGNIFLSHHFM